MFLSVRLLDLLELDFLWLSYLSVIYPNMLILVEDVSQSFLNSEAFSVAYATELNQDECVVEE